MGVMCVTAHGAISMKTGYYSDPTAWTAIANVDRQSKRKQKLTEKVSRPRIGTYHAPGSETKTDRKYVIYRQENRRSPILKAMRKAIESFGEVNGE